MSDRPRWLPNLVSGVSIWKLARDLNEDAYMDGRLLVPETTGSESLPSDVRWPTQNLVPLAAAHAKYPNEVANATREFSQALERVAAVFGKSETGFHKYREAFSVPSLEADEGANYFFDPARNKLFVIHWGATPRTLSSTKNQVFTWGDFGKFAKDAAPVAPAPAGVLAVVAAGVPVSKEEKKEEKKPEDEKKKRAWWWWLLALLGIVFLLLLLWWLLRDCNPSSTGGADAGVDASADASLDASADASLDAQADASLDAQADAMADAEADASADASNDGASDAKSDASKDGSTDAKTDAAALTDDGEDDDSGGEESGGGGGGGGSGGGSGGGDGPPPKVKQGPSSGDGTDGPHTKHFHKDAVNWRVSAGNDRVLRTERTGKRFDVYLAPGKTFDGVRVEYKDKKGAWHRY